MCGNNICTAIYSLEDGETTQVCCCDGSCYRLSSRHLVVIALLLHQNNGDILCYDGKSVLFGSGYICRPPVNPEQFDYCDPEDEDEGYL